MKTKKRTLFTYLKRAILNAFYSLSRYAGIDQNVLSVLCYHGIEDGGNFYSVGVQELEKQIEKMKKTARFISADEALGVLDGRRIKESEVCLTIDDGYANVMKILPITKKYRIPVTVFVLSNPEKADRQDLDHYGKLLTVDQIKHLYLQGWTIGCHSSTHRDFRKLSQKELEKEIVDSKKTLEKKLSFEIKYFAYPKGIYNKDIIKIAGKAGYKAAFAVALDYVKPSSDKWALPRMIVDGAYTASDFPAAYSRTAFILRRTAKRMGLLL